MLQSTPEIDALLAQKTLAFADIFVLTLAGGEVIKVTSADVAVTLAQDFAINGVITFPAGTYGRDLVIERGTITQQVGLTVDTCDISIYCGDDAAIFGVPVPAFTRAGGFKGATMLIGRAVFDPADIDAGVKWVFWRFNGKLQEPKPGDFSISIKIMPVTVEFDTEYPAHIIQHDCIFVPYDTGCGLIKANFTTTGTAGADSTRILINAVSGSWPSAKGDNWFRHGVIRFTAGANAGQQRSVKTQTGTAITVNRAFDYPVAVGDAFEIWPGCDRGDESIDGVVTQNSSEMVVHTNLTQPNGTFNGAVMVMMSGQNVNKTRHINTYANGNLNITFKLKVQAGDSFVIFPKAASIINPSGCLKFDNMARRVAFPFTGNPEDSY